MPDEVVGKLLDFGFAAGVVEVFEMAETQKARGDAGEDGGGFDGFPINGVVAAAQGEGTGRGDAETVHGFGTEVFADGGAQDGASVGKAGVGRFACAFKLPLLALSRGIDGIANQNGASVAEARSIDAELMAAVNAGNGRGCVLRRVAAEVGKVGGRLKICIQIQLCRQIGVEGDPVGRGQRLGGNAGIEKRREFGELLAKQGKGVHGIPDGCVRVCLLCFRVGCCVFHFQAFSKQYLLSLFQIIRQRFGQSVIRQIFGFNPKAVWRQGRIFRRAGLRFKRRNHQ